MTANAKNRKTIRTAIATGLSTVLVGTNKPCAEVVNYQKKTIDKTPLVEVMSSSSMRGVKGMGTSKYSNHFQYEINVLIRDTDDSGLNEEEREDALDDIEKAIADWVGDNRSTANWDRLGYVGERSQEDVPEPTQIIKVIYDKPYLLEVIKLEAFVND